MKKKSKTWFVFSFGLFLVSLIATIASIKSIVYNDKVIEVSENIISSVSILNQSMTMIELILSVFLLLGSVVLMFYTFKKNDFNKKNIAI
ncbi:MAG: hypothetical protein ACRQFF_11200 [Sphaerochaeta sp.]